ncbi:hypothetical protein G4B88_021091 [Cannabis sativa]|uniref:mitogen-activated protein kinase kinase n=1 Tax=Cannabis sativa TaxID=3483 RepID=A0A7J6HX66_CANSA|nr:hypothetical protein G4B88_021091 [Cannabis sativa]
MAGLEELRKKLTPLFDSEKGFSSSSTFDPSDSYTLSDGGTVNLLSQSYGVYNINELGLQKCTASAAMVDATFESEKTYRCASHEMRVFGAIGNGASSVVQRAIHIPTHRILALKKINIFEKEKRQQLLTEIRTLCEAPCYEGLVEFHGAFYTPDSGQISIALEYMDGGSLADILKLRKKIPEPVLSSMFQKLLHGLSYLHGVRHLVHRDIKPANLLVNLKGEPKITDFGISAGLENSVAMCATFVGTAHNYAWVIWQILEDPSPSPSKHNFSPEFCSFIEACLQKDADARPTAEQLLSHPFIIKYKDTQVDLAEFVKSMFDPTQKMKDLADMLTIHYYQLFDGPDDLWQHSKTLFNDDSIFSFSGKQSVGGNEIFATLSSIRSTLAGDWPSERLVHVVEKLQCRAHGQDGVAIRVSGTFIIGNQFLICGDGLQPEGLPNFKDLSIDLSSRRMGTFREQFIMEPSSVIGRYFISKQELYIMQ